MSRSSKQVDERAIEWLIRMRDPAFSEWAELTTWLEQDDAHRRSFDTVSRLDAEVAELLTGRRPPA